MEVAAAAHIYADYGLADLKPYTSWIDFAQHIKNPASIINFVAAYGTHATITGVDTIEGKRAAAVQLLFQPPLWLQLVKRM